MRIGRSIKQKKEYLGNNFAEFEGNLEEIYQQLIKK